MELHIKASPEVLSFYEDHSFAEKGDSGLDLFFPNDIIIPAHKTVLVDLGISCELKVIQTNFKLGSENILYVNKSLLMMPRSSIYKTPLRMANSLGLIDSEYRGILKVPIDNISDIDYNIKKGQKLFQLVAPNLEQFNIVLSDKLSSTERGQKGFGSSGI
mgnify:CR=1 FL=1